MRHLYLFYWLILSAACACAQCPPGNVDIFSQAELNDFLNDYPNCTELNGDLVIGRFDMPTDITDLSGLSNVIGIGGSLRLTNNPQLTSLTGLDNLSYIVYDLELSDNPLLTTLASLQNLTSLGSHLIVYGSTALTDLTGLDGITSTGGWVEIRFNENLTSLQGLHNLKSVHGEYLFLLSNPSLPSVDALAQLDTLANSLLVINNAALTSLEGFSGLTQIGGAINVSDNAVLPSLTGLHNITQIDGILWIDNNPTLASIAALENIAPAGITELSLRNNPLLSVCEYPNICEYLSTPVNIATIADNAANCASRAEVEEACLDVSVTDAVDAAHRIYPNPTTGRLYFRDLVPERAILTDARGRRLATYGSAIREVDLSGRPAGVYYLRFWVSGDVYVTRVVKTRA